MTVDKRKEGEFVFRRGDIYRIDFGKKEDSSVQGGIRPAIILSNNKNNKHSPTVTVIKLTSQIKKEWMSVHVTMVGYGLPKTSMALAEQITTIDKKDLLSENYIGHIDDESLLDEMVEAVVVQISNI